MSIYGSSNLKLIPSGSTDIQDSVYTISPLLSKAVHVTIDNKTIIGARESGPAFPVTGPRKVIVMDESGHAERVFEYDRHNKPLFTLPLAITSNIQGNIAVTDRISDDARGRVVVLNKRGEVRNIYTGHPDVNNEDNPFKPGGITTTPLDNFVITDMNTHTLHILNSEGEIITFYNTEELGIRLPLSLSFSSKGQLCLGCSTYENSGDKAKYFVIDNFVF